MTRGRRTSATTMTEMEKLRDHDMYTPSVPPRTVAKAVTTRRFGDQKPRLATKARASAALRTPEIERDVLTSADGSSDSGRNRTRAIGIPSDPIPTRNVTVFTIVAA